MLRKLMVVILAAVLTIAGVVGFRGAGLSLAEPEPATAVDFAVDGERAVANLAAAIRFRTISDGEGWGRYEEEFVGLRGFLESAYPRVHGVLERELVGGHTLLFRWPGEDATLPPILLMGHMDVVPVEPGTEGAWTHGPFAGVVAGGYIWGRGALDNKQNVIGLLEAVEHLLAEGYRPERTVYLLFGHDEEVGGAEGAAAAATLLSERGVRFELVLDEGGLILEPEVIGTSAPLAIVRTAEKGYLTLELVVRGEGGHSSRPPAETPVGILSRAIVALESHPFPARLDGAALEMIRAVAPDQGLLARSAVANRWLLDGVVLRLLSRDPSGNASIRTTIAPTMLQGSPKDNVLPSRVSATVNLRLLPGDSVAYVVERVRRVINDDRVAIETRMAIEPSPTSDAASPNFALLSRTIRQVAPDARVTPYLALGATDARHFTGLSDDVYGFTPVRADAEALTRAHGTNERVATADVEGMVRFYVQFIRNATGAAHGGPSW
jgi:carboxypeptidase PM20D1